MAMICPQCHGSYEERVECPSCGVRLFYQAERPAIPRPASMDSSNTEWQNTPWGRIIVGIILAQGLYQGFWNFVLALQSALGDESSVPGLLVRQALQLVCLMLGGGIAGAGQQRGAIYGGLVGLGNGILAVLLEVFEYYRGGTNGALAVVSLYTQPLLHTMFGTIGGFMGMVLWKPVPATLDPGLTPRPLGSTTKTAAGHTAPYDDPAPASAFGGQLGWTSILAGVTIAVLGTVFADVILNFLFEVTERKPRHYEQSMLLTWEIFAASMLIGGAVAGAARENGPKQGLMTGLITGLIIIFLNQTALNGFKQIVAHLLVFKPELLGLLPRTPTLLATSITTVLCTSGIGMAGGWFGYKLMPSYNTVRHKIKFRVRPL